VPTKDALQAVQTHEADDTAEAGGVSESRNPGFGAETEPRGVESRMCQ